MDLKDTPGLTAAERAAVASYEEAHRAYAASAVGGFVSFLMRDEHDAAEHVERAIQRIEETYSRLSELAPSSTPGREGGMGRGELLALLRRLEIGDRDVAKLNDPPVPWEQLPRRACSRSAAWTLCITGSTPAAL